jgi:hypothetical protein
MELNHLLIDLSVPLSHFGHNQINDRYRGMAGILLDIALDIKTANLGE